MDLDQAADELYAISPDDFVTRRTELMAEARAAGDRALAKEIGQLRKPTRSAWLVNLLARAEGRRITELLELGTALQRAQQRMDGDELRRLSTERRKLIDALARTAADLGLAAGYDAADAATQEVSQTLQAALSDVTLAAQLTAGRMHQAASYGGFGPDDLASMLAASMPAAGHKAAAADVEAEEPAPPGRSDRKPERKATEAAQAARQAADAARAAAEEAAAVAEAATAKADELADRVESLRAELRAEENREREAREEARAARKRLAELTKAAAVAEDDARSAEARLDQS
jgi:hypothetical protein